MLEKLNTPIAVGSSITIVVLVTLVAILTMLLFDAKIEASYPCECECSQRSEPSEEFRTIEETVVSEEISMISF